MRTSIGLVWVLALCSCGRSGRVDCDPDEDLSVRDGIAELDRDHDGVLTSDDLKPGQVGAVLSWLGPEGKIGTSVHLSSNSPAILSSTTADWEPVWGADEFLRDCSQEVYIGVGFQQENRNLTTLETGDHELTNVTITIPRFEVRPLYDRAIADGVVRITQATPTVSGHLEGHGEVELATILVEPPEPTGQTVRMEAFAFREL